MLRRETIVLALPESEVVSCFLAGEAALLSLRQSTYYGLGTVGAYVWELIKPGLSVEAIHHALLERFDVEPERCERDLLALLLQMKEAELITIQPYQRADAPSARPAGQQVLPHPS